MMSVSYTPAPGLAFVRKIETAERYAGSQIVIPEQARDKIAASQWEIVACGGPELCMDEDCTRIHIYSQTVEHQGVWVTPAGKVLEEKAWHPVDIVPGDWVLVKKRAPMPTPDPELYVIRQADALGRFVERG